MSGAEGTGGLEVWGHLEIVINRCVTSRREFWIVQSQSDEGSESECVLILACITMSK